MRNGYRQVLAMVGCSAVLLGLGACAAAPSHEGLARADSRNDYADARSSREERRVERRQEAAASERDELITSLIREQFARDLQVAAGDIDIDTYRGTVELSGLVDDSKEIHRAVNIALATPGVRTVRNDMRVSRP